MKFDMNKKIVTLVNSLREGTVGKTCMGTGNYSFDIITRREYPDGFVVGKRNKYEEKILTMEIGNTCGNVMTMLPYLGVKTFPVAKFDVSPQGYQMKRDMKAYGADVRFVSNMLGGGTTILRCMQWRPWWTRWTSHLMYSSSTWHRPDTGSWLRNCVNGVRWCISNATLTVTGLRMRKEEWLFIGLFSGVWRSVTW